MNETFINVNCATALTALRAQLEDLGKVEPKTAEILDLILVLKKMIAEQEWVIARAKLLMILEPMDLIKKTPKPSPTPGGMGF